MTTSTNNPQKKKEPFVSNYDPSVFHVPLCNKTPRKPGLPIHNLVDYPIKLRVTLKDIGLKGLDSPYVKKTSKVRKSDLQKNQDKPKPDETDQIHFPTEPPQLTPRIKQILTDYSIEEPIYESTFYQNRIYSPRIAYLCSDLKPQTTFPKANQRGNQPVNTFKERSIPVPEGDIPFEKQIKRDNRNRFVDINDAPILMGPI